jgi:diadenosine tetraphosphate (Ap4A) HIT family hydrolase
VICYHIPEVSYHYRKTRKAYEQNKKKPGCPFCDAARREKLVYENEHLFVVHNLTKYDVWELHDVHEHLLVIPKRHVESLAELTDKEKSAVIDFIADYESRGYNVYARGVGFARRSVKHQHTHLIKADNKHPKFSLFIKKPYVLIKK